MGADPVSLTLGAIGGFTAYQDAERQGELISQQVKLQRHAFQVQRRQIEEQATLEKDKRSREAAQIRGRLRVIAGETGLGVGALTSQATIDLARNREIIDRNAANNIAFASSQSRLKIAALSAGKTDPFVAALTGGMTGMQAGLQLSSLSSRQTQLNQTNAQLDAANADFNTLSEVFTRE